MKKLVLLASVSLALVSLKAWSFTWDVRAYNGRTAASFDITSTTRANDSVFVNDSEGFNQSNDTVLGVLIDETTTLISGNGWFEVQVQQSLGGPFGSMGLTSLDPPVDGSAGQTWPIVWPSLDYGVLWGLGNQLYFQTNGAYGSLGEGVIFNGDVVRVEVIAPDQVVIKVNGSIVCYFTDTSCSNNPSNTVPSISYPLKPYISARYTGVDVINADASFLSSQPGVISGYIYDQNIQPTPGGAATVFDQSGNFIDHFFVDENGYWETYQLEPGTYYLKTDFANGFINDVWDGAEGTQCPNRLCTVTDWTPVNLGSGDFLTNYDFVLDPIPGGGRRVIGQVTDNVAAPLREVRVIITNNQGGYLTEARTDSSGNYRTGLLPDDDYYVYTGTAPTGFAQEVYDNAVCSPGFTCDDPSVVTAIGTPITIAGADAAADFALDNAVDLGAGVFGQVTGDGLPLADVGVELFDEFGNYYGGRGTAANGDYSFYGLDTDGRTYRLRVNGPPPGYDFELHSNLSCPDNGCDPTTGTPIAVGSEIDVQLDYVGGTPRFYGQVINSDTLQGVSSSIGYMAVNLYDDAGNFIGGVATDAGGRYQFDLTEYERGAGSYFLVTSQDLGYHGLVDEVNDGTPCFGGCNPFDAGATPVVITGGESQRIDFSLQPTLKIRGRITDSATTDPIFDVQVDVWKANGEYVSSARTDGNGDYAVSIPSDGGYFAFTPNYGVPAPYLPEVWDGATGTYCDFQVCDVLTTGTQIGVSGADATGIDFDLDSGFTISGTVFDEGANPIDGVTVCVHRTDGSFAGVCGSSAADGSYSTDALPAGVDYTAYAIGDELGFIREMWDNIECPGSNCDFGIATPIALGPGDATGIDFTLRPSDPGVLRGFILDQNGQPTPGGAVRITDDQNNFYGHVFVDENGYWETWPLPTGTYYLRTDFTNGVIDDVWDDGDGAQCPNGLCNVFDWSPIHLASGDNLGEYTFILDPIGSGGRITGRVEDIGGNGLPLVDVILHNRNGDEFDYARTDLQGNYEFGLQVDETYYVRVQNTPSGLAGELWDNFACLPEIICDGRDNVTANGTAIDVVGADVPGVDFVLEEAPPARVVGQVTDAGNSLPLSGVGVQLFDEFGNYQGGTSTDGDGNYQFLGISDGEYRVYVNGPPEGYQMELYLDVPCPDYSCDFAVDGEPVVVSGGTAVANIALDYVGGPRFMGVVTRSDTGEPVISDFAYMGVNVFNDLNQQVGGTGTNRAGVYQLFVEPGTYYLATDHDRGYHALINECHENVACENNFDPAGAGATLVPIADGQTIEINFELDPAQTISGTVTATDGGFPIQGVWLDLFDASGNFITNAGTDSLGRYNLLVPGDGEYRVVTSGVPAPYLPESHLDNYCNLGEGCDPVTDGDPVFVSGGNSTTNIDFSLESGFTISGTVFDEGFNPIEGVGVCIHRTDGSWTGVCGGSGPDGTYMTGALPAGVDYTAYAIGDDLGFIREMWDNIECPGSNCDFGTATPIPLGPGDATGIDFTLRPSDPGVLSGYIYDQNLEPTPGGAVAIYDENNEFYGHAWTDENGYWQTWDLPTGTYYLRTQFSNGFIGDVWDGGEGAQCPNGLCNVFDWSPVHLGSGDFLTNIDFVLDPIESGGSISGNVQNEGGEPLAMIRMILMNRNGDYVREVETDPQGNYDFGLQLDETYYVRTGMGPGGLAAELWDDVKCLPEFQCDDRDHVVANGFAINVVGADVPGIDFVLNPAPGRRITGRISDAFTGIPLSDVGVTLYDEFGNWWGGTSSDSTGHYQFLGLPDGLYRVFADGPREGYEAELFQDVPCGDYSCDIVAEGTVVDVTAGNDSADIAMDFAGTRIIGEVKRSDNSAPVPSIFGYMGVNVFDESGNQVGGTGTDRAGVYQLFLEPGTYYLATDHDQGYHGLFNECYNNIPCADNFDPLGAGATPVALAEGQTLEISFFLDPLPAISGTVLVDDGSTVSAAAGEIQALVLTPELDFVAATDIASDGTWSLNVAPGDYLIAATPYMPGTYQQYVAEFADGTRVAYSSESNLFTLAILSLAIPPFTVSGDTTGIDITLEQGVTIEGTLSDENTGVPLTGGVVTTNTPTFDRELSYGFVRPDGTYTVAAFPAEDFKLFHSGFAVGYGREIGGSIKCLRDGPGGCDDAAAAAPTVSPAIGDTLSFEVDVVRRIELSGTVLDDGNNPLIGARVTVRVAEDGYVAAEAWTDGSGFWAVGNVAPGGYYVTVRGEDFGLVGQVYNELGSNDCPFEGCDYATLGSLVENFDGVDKGGIDFALNAQQFAIVTGSVLDANGQPTTGGAAAFIDPFGDVYQEAWLDNDGNFAINLPDGSYTVVTRFTFGVIDDQWDGIDGSPCPNQICDFGAGMPIVVSGGVASDSPNFVLDFIPNGGYRIRGQVTDDIGNPLPEVRVIITNREGSYLGELRTDREGFYRSNPLTNDEYFAYTGAEPTGFARELWDGHVCSPALNCEDPAVITTNGAPIVVLDGEAIADFALDSVDLSTSIFGQVTGDGLPLANVNIELFDEFGNYWGGRVTAFNGDYSFYGLDNDGRSYRLRVNNPPPGYDFELYNDRPCPGNGCDPIGEGDPVFPASEIDIDLPYIGTTPRFYGQVVNSDTLQGVSSSIAYMGVQLWDADGNIVANTGTDPNGRYQFILSDYELGAGTYYLVTEQDQAYHGLINETNDGTQCFSDCNPLNIGAAPEVPTADENLRVDFSLEPALKISGTVTDAFTSEPVEGVQLDAWNANGDYVASGSTNAQGGYSIAVPFGGDYYVFTPSYGIPIPYLPDVWDGGDGTGCNFFVCDILSTGMPITVGPDDATGIDLALDTGFTISGNISAAGGGPLEGVNVCVHLLTGEWTGVCTDLSGADGGYTTWALPAGTDYAAYAIPDDFGFRRQMWDGLDCPANQCDFSLATPITLGGSPANAAGIDFVVNPASSLTGTISSSTDGLPLGQYEGRARIYDDSGQLVTTVLTDENGVWQAAGLEPGTYYVLASPRLGDLIDELYNEEVSSNAQCPRLSCNFASLGTPVVLGEQATIGGLDVELDKGSRISGLIFADGSPLANGILFIFDGSGVYAGFGIADENGFWQSGSGFPAGDYRVASRSPDQPETNLAYFPVAWPNRPCGEPCDPLTGASILLNGIDAVGGIDFNLVSTSNGSRLISGTVTSQEGGAPIDDVRVCTSSLGDPGLEVCTITDLAGEYALFGLPELSDYVVFTADVGGKAFYPEVFENLPCCDTAAGTPVDLTIADAIIDFQLEPSGLIAGRVTDVTTDASLGGIEIQLLDETCGAVEVIETFTNDVEGPDLGRYAISGVPDGVYYLFAAGANMGYVGELYPNEQRITACSDGEFPAGQAIVVENRTQVTGVDLALEPGGSISGMISDVNGPLSAFRGQAILYSPDQTPILSTLNAEPDQSYTIRGLPPRAYTVIFSSRFLGLVDERYDDIPCPRGSCDLELGTPVEVGYEEHVTGIDAVLESGSVISGRLTNGATGTGLPSQFVSVYTSDGIYATLARSDADGFYQTLTGLPAGDYYLSNQYVRGDFALPVDNGYLPQAWTSDGSFGTCGDPCDPLLGDPITVNGIDPVTVDLAMEKGSTISGLVQASGLPLEGASIALYNETGNQIRLNQTDAAGQFRFESLGSGEYYVRTVNGLGYTDRLHAEPTDIVCAPYCNLFSGSPIPIGAATDVGGIDFELTSASTISGWVWDETDQRLPGVTVEAYDTQARLAASAITNSNGEYMLTGLGIGEFYLRTRNSLGLLDRLWGGQVCVGECDPRDGERVNIPTYNQNVTGYAIRLTAGGDISGTLTGETDSAPVPLGGVTINVYDLSGSVVAAARTEFDGRYVVRGLAAGEYHLETSYQGLDYTNVLDDGSTCQGCDPIDEVTVTVSEGTVLDLNLTLPRTLSINARLEDTSGNLLYSSKTDKTIRFSVAAFDSAGTLVRSAVVPTGPIPEAPLDAAGDPVYNVQLRGLLPGEYFLRTYNTQNYQDEIYDDVPCFEPCGPAEGTPVVVSEDAAAPVAEFVLDVSNTISGRVTQNGSDPVVGLAGITVELYTDTGLALRSTTTDSDGFYRFGGLPNADYRVRTSGNHASVDQVYGGAACSPEACNILGGSLITLTNANRSDINFALDGGNTLRVYARDQYGNPIAGVAELFSATGQSLEQVDVGTDGIVTISGLASGTYFVYLDARSTAISYQYCYTYSEYHYVSWWEGGHYHYYTRCETRYRYTTSVDTVFNGLACPDRSCDITSGTPVSIGAAPAAQDTQAANDATFVKLTAESGTTTTIEITTPEGRLLRGSVTGPSGLPVAQTQVYFFDGNGTPAGSAITDGSGEFITESGLPDGTYYAATSRAARPFDSPGEARDAEDGVGRGLQDQVWNGVACNGVCVPGPGNGTPIVISGADVGGIDIVLEQAAAIELEKLTNGVDADSPNSGDAPIVAPGETVFWTYNLTNTGADDLQNIIVSDDRGVTVTCPGTTLVAGGTMSCTGSEAAADLTANPFNLVGRCNGESGKPMYQNTGTVTAETVEGWGVTDSDTSHYCNTPPPPVATCNLTVVVGTSVADDAMFEACETLAVGDNVTIEAGSETMLSSGLEIYFLPDFRVNFGGILDVEVCGQSLCEVSDQPMPDGCHSCVVQICDIDPDCCGSAFSQACVDKVSSVCELTCE